MNYPGAETASEALKMELASRAKESIKTQPEASLSEPSPSQDELENKSPLDL